MKNVVIHCNAIQWQREYAPRFIRGFEEHGLDVHTTDRDRAVPNRINVVFANNSWKKTVAECTRAGYPLITVNRCFFGSRFDMVAIGWDGFNGDADFCLDDVMPPDRWEKNGCEVKPWRTEGDYVLVCGEFRDMAGWYKKLSQTIIDEPVRFRPHPFVLDKLYGWLRAPGKPQDDIETSLARASACITYDSIAGCDAVINGVPSITYGERAMAYPVSSHSWGDFLEYPHLPDRQPWLDRLAYCQWTHDEISSGEFWEHLRRGLTKRQKREK